MKTLSSTLVCLLITFTLQAQKVITVDNRENAGADYSSFSDAVDNATVGDTIQIHPSATGYGNKTINLRLVIVGMGHDPSTSKINETASVGNITFGGASANSLITGLTIGNISIAAGSDADNIQVINNKITGSAITGRLDNDDWIIEGNLFITATVNVSSSNNWIVKNNIFDNTSAYAIQGFDNTSSFLNNILISSTGNFANGCADPIVNNNIFILEGSTTDINLNSSTVVYNNCLTRNVQGQTVTSLNGSNNLDNTDPGFSFSFLDIADYYNNDYNVSGAAVNAGTDGTDLGVHGAMFNFDPQGRPDLWPYMTSLDISNSSVPMGQDLDVTFTAGKKN
ncbi:hypothetical protein OE09_0783 [Flavobacteriaceae bacterium MAR_2010_72]|nr:hypothetical protein OE09_0783 [Flavobacteriaceae bacterium MAR_2010_72]TVZ57575.1 hypothetical protein NA63_0060 [Flavobacteriaceae bacterium MAR_2010_105]